VSYEKFKHSLMDSFSQTCDIAVGGHLPVVRGRSQSSVNNS
jgi:hypothetical protein